jgi:beta-galactosidase
MQRSGILSCGVRWVCALAMLSSAGAAFCAAPGAPRSQISLDAGWRFRQAAGLTGVDAATFDDSDWTTVDVPHTWNRIGNEGTERSALSNNVQGIGWYRLHFQIPQEPSRPRRYFLQFDGVGEIADVWLNGHYLGKHAGAFARFRFDASSWLHPSGDNVLVVKADNSRPQPGSSTQDVIPLKGDFLRVRRNLSQRIFDRDAGGSPGLVGFRRPGFVCACIAHRQ